jgi:4-hydroxy-tetrahydrodipicolinate reductase
MIKAVVTGASGRMGSRIINVLSASEGIRLSAAVEKKGHPQVGQDACGPAGIPPGGVLNLITDDLGAALKAGDVAIDFTHPEASPDMVQARLGVGEINGPGLRRPQKAHRDRHYGLHQGAARPDP